MSFVKSCSRCNSACMAPNGCITAAMVPSLAVVVADSLSQGGGDASCGSCCHATQGWMWDIHWESGECQMAISLQWSLPLALTPASTALVHSKPFFWFLECQWLLGKTSSIERPKTRKRSCWSGFLFLAGSTGINFHQLIGPVISPFCFHRSKIYRKAWILPS